MTQHVHHSAAQGYTADADSYVRGRPDYPPELAQWLVETLGLGPQARVVDLGAGTGKFTPRLKQTSAHVTAVEPVDTMRENSPPRSPISTCSRAPRNPFRWTMLPSMWSSARSPSTGSRRTRCSMKSIAY